MQLLYGEFRRKYNAGRQDIHNKAVWMQGSDPITKFSNPKLAGIAAPPVVGRRSDDVEDGCIVRRHKNLPQ